MLNISKIQADIEQMRVANNKYLAETDKLRKETKFYPMLTLTMGISAVIGVLYRL